MYIIVLLVQTLVNGLKDFSEVTWDLFSKFLGVVLINKVGVYFQLLLDQFGHF